MSVDTGTFSAITAEVAMLREHAARHAPGRRRRPARPAGWRRPRPLDGYWWGGYAAAMAEVVEVAGETAAAGQAQGWPAARLSAAAVNAVLAVAEAGIELQDTDTPPAAWSQP